MGGGVFSSHVSKYQLPTLFDFTEHKQSEFVCLFVCLFKTSKETRNDVFSLGASSSSSSSTSSKFFLKDKIVSGIDWPLTTSIISDNQQSYAEILFYLFIS